MLSTDSFIILFHYKNLLNNGDKAHWLSIFTAQQNSQSDYFDTS